PWLRWTRGRRSVVGSTLGPVLRLPTGPLDLPALSASYISEWTREKVAGSGAGPDGPVILPGVDRSLFAPAPRPPGPVRRFLQVGRIEPRKGQAVALEALAALRGAG